MVGRQESELARLVSGNIFYYEHLNSKRNPLFLQRNLRRVLQLHKEELEQLETRTLGRDHHHRQFWRMPSPREIKNDREKQGFHLLIKAIKPINEDGNVTFTEIRPSKKKEPLFRESIQLHATIWEHQNQYRCKSFNDLKATLLGIQTSRSKEMSVNTNEIVATADDLLLPDERSWTRGIGKEYEAMISINFHQSNTAADILSHIGLELPEVRQDGSTRWVTRLPNILQSGGEARILPLYYVASGANKKRLPIGLEVSIHYTTHRGESLLAAHNQRLKSSQREIRCSVDLDAGTTTEPKFTVSFVYLEDTKTFSELRCPHCPRLRYRDVDDLHMHLICYHDFFQYRPRKEREISGTQYWVFECEVADHKADQRASDKAPDPREIQILAPKRPFNQRKYLREANENWQKEARLERPSKQLSSKVAGPPPNLRRRAPDEVQPKVNRVRRKYRIPRAPNGVTFFRAATKRPLAEGEYISESDDDPDMEWLRLRTENLLMSDADIPEKVKIFLKTFNLYMREERLQDETHMGDAIIRFTHEKGEWIYSEGLHDEFRKKIAELLDNQTISQEIHDGCVKIITRQAERRPERKSHPEISATLSIHPTPPRTPLSPSTVPSINETELTQRLKSNDPSKMNKGKASVTELGQTTPQTTDYDGDVEMMDSRRPAEASIEDVDNSAPANGTCICGREALVHGRENIIYCESDFCIRHTFHIDCIMKHWKPKEQPALLRGGWVCRDCERDPNIETGDKQWYGT